MADKGGNNDNGKILHLKRDHAFFVKLGDMKRAQNDPLSALARYREALALEPHDLDTRLAAAELLTDMSRFNDSNKLLIPYMHEDEEFKTDAYCIVGFNLLGMNELEGARNCFNRFFDLTDEVSERTDAILDALDYIDSLSEDGPILMDASAAEKQKQITSANEAFDRGDFEGSARILRELVKKEPEDTGILYDLALSCLCSYHADESEVYIDKLLSIDENNWPGWSLKLMYAKGKKNELDVKKICRKLEKCDSVLPDELFRVNGSLLEADCPELALVFAKRLVKLLPYDSLANHRLAISYAKLKKYRQAADVYGRLLRIDSGDFIASYYRSLCLALEEKQGGTMEFTMLQYQLPFDRVINLVKELLSGNSITADEINARWRRDGELKRIVRWAFTLHEANINFAMISLLRLVGDETAQMMIREAASDIDAGRALINEAFGTLKRLSAPEPYFAVYNGNLLEGRVNLVDLSSIRIPKAYKDIFSRFDEKTKDIYDASVRNAAAGNAEKFIASSAGDFKKLTEAQSAALSAALEVLTCEQCGVEPSEDILVRYDITHRRLLNAIDRMMNVILFGTGKLDDKNTDGEDK